MAVVDLVPKSDISNSPAWTLSTGSDVYALLNNDDTGNPTSDGSQITATATGKKCIVTFDDFDDTDVDSIESVQGIIKANVYERAKTYSIGMTIRSPIGISWPEELTTSTNSSGSWVTFNFTVQTEKHDLFGGAWNNFTLDNIRMEIHANALTAGGTLRVTYAYFKVSYTAAAAADNATFFGANF